MLRSLVLGCLLSCVSFGSNAWAATSWTAQLDSLRAGSGRAAAARAQGDVPRYLAELESLHRQVPDWPWIVYRLAGAHMLLGHRTEAVRFLNQAISLGVGEEAEGDPALAPLWEGPDADSLRRRIHLARTPAGDSTVAFRLTERDLFPEGIAYDPVGRRFFLSSLYKRKVVTVDSTGTAADFTREEQDSLWSGLGMKVDASRRRLWLATSEQELMRGYQAGRTNRAALLCYDVDTGRLLHRSEVVPRGDSASSAVSHLLNDLVVTSAGDLYVTDTDEGTVYRADGETGRLERILDPGTLPNANGIALDEERNRLYVAHALGIAIVDLATRTVTELSRSNEVSLTGGDGLYRVGNDLLIMQTIFRRILQLRLDATGRAVESFRVLVARQPRFREITTGVVVGDDLFYVATSQYAALLGGTRPPPPDQLGDIFIMRAGLREKEPRTGRSALEEELRAVETAFARTMAERDSMGFDAFLSEEAIFVGSRSVLRGRGAVSAGWRRFFAGGDAPFSWQPEQAEVLDDGSLGWTSGPVFDPEGKRIGTFNSTWRNEKGGWKILFDRGCPPCPSSP